MNTELTGLQKMQIAYAYFTLEEWQLLAKCVRHVAREARDGTLPQGNGVTQNKVNTMLVKFPSAVL
jgi:hypothetical protein